jgi:N12 class adenine-specific DNA methylase
MCVKSKVALRIDNDECKAWFLVDTRDSRKAEKVLETAYDDWLMSDEDVELQDWLEGRLITSKVDYE